MITAVRANKSTFRAVEFTQGLNVVMADRTKESTKKDSRNGLGKSTLLEIISFCLGGSAGALGVLDDWEFTIGLRLGARDLQVSRSIKDSRRVRVSGEVEGLEAGRQTANGLQLTDAEWTRLLGALVFGLSPTIHGEKWAPTFRSLIAYFLRRGKDAYSTPFEHFRKQKEWDKQVANAFLLGLCWQDAQAWELLRERKKGLEALTSAARSGLVEGFTGRLGELEAEKIRLEERAKIEAEALGTFKVHPNYRNLEETASRLTLEIHKLSNENVSDRNLLAHYRRSLEEIADTDDQDVVRLFREAGVSLPQLVQRRLEEVRTFHSTLIRNRRLFVETELLRLGRAIEERESTAKALTAKRAGLLAVLKEHGALEEFTLMQSSHLETVASVRDLESRIANLRLVDAGKSDLKIQNEQLYQRASRDLSEREAARREAIKLFNENSQALYAQPGRLVIEITHSGFKFDIEIERAKSAGIGNMKIFCYDLTLAQLWAKNPVSPGFLIHDSLIFDGVDERQKATALQRAASVSEKANFQYICTINSDAVPYGEFPDGFRFDDFVRLRLTDETPEGCLLGIRF